MRDWYGVTWATPDHTIAQTGYVFRFVTLAKVAARLGPKIIRAITQVDGMCPHYPATERPLYGRVETEDRAIDEVRVMTR